jgi:hypothetical protein
MFGFSTTAHSDHTVYQIENLYRFYPQKNLDVSYSFFATCCQPILVCLFFDIACCASLICPVFIKYALVNKVSCNDVEYFIKFSRWKCDLICLESNKLPLITYWCSLGLVWRSVAGCVVNHHVTTCVAVLPVVSGVTCGLQIKWRSVI